MVHRERRLAASNGRALSSPPDVPLRAAPDLRAGEEIPPEPQPPFDLCGRCGGPAYLCDRIACEHDHAVDLDARDRLWLTAVRALMLGTFLCRTVASSYGGVLLRAARALVGASDPPPWDHLAGRLPHPGYELRRDAAAALATAYLRDGDLAALSRLSASLYTTNDALLWRRRLAAEKAALSLPSEGARSTLLALVCDDCAGEHAAGESQRLEAAATFDAAIECPRCRAPHKHPLPGLPIGRPHPVTRCTGGLAGDRRRCLIHGELLGPEDVCGEGFPALAKARAWAADRPEELLSTWPDLARALQRAQRMDRDRRLASGDRIFHLHPGARGFFAAVAAMSPGAAAAIEKLTGAGLSVEEVDPEVRDELAAAGSMVRGLFSTPLVHATPSPRRHKK